MPETALPNAESARTETGELKDQQTPQTTTTETKTTETAPPSDKTSTTSSTDSKGKESLLNEKAPEGDKKAPAATGAPEKYEAFKAPEGYEYNLESLAEAHKVFKDLGLSQEAGQALMDLYGKQIVEAENSPYKAWEAQQNAWREEIKNDPVIGGKLDQVRTATSRMIDGLGDPKMAADFREAMNFTGAGNNPAFIRTFYALAQRLTEGGAATGGGPPGGTGTKPTTAAQAMYPNLPSGR